MSIFKQIAKLSDNNVEEEMFPLFDLPLEMQLAVLENTDFYTRHSLRLSSKVFKNRVDVIKKLPVIKIGYYGSSWSKTIRLYYDMNRIHNELYVEKSRRDGYIKVTCKGHIHSNASEQTPTKTIWTLEERGSIASYFENLLKKYEKSLKGVHLTSSYFSSFDNSTNFRMLRKLTQIKIDCHCKFSDLFRIFTFEQLKNSDEVSLLNVTGSISMNQLLQIPMKVVVLKAPTFTFDEILDFIELWRRGEFKNFDQLILQRYFFKYTDLIALFVDHLDRQTHLIECNSYVDDHKYLQIRYQRGNHTLLFGQVNYQ